MNTNSPTRPKKYFSRYKKPLAEMPQMVESQLVSFADLVEKGLPNLLKEFSSIKDYAEKKFELSFGAVDLIRPKYDEHYAKINKLNYEGQIKVVVTLKNKSLNVVKEQEMFLADLPLMTDHGTFIINGVERVIVPQLARSFGIFFTSTEVKGKNNFGAKIIPARGVWMEIETDVDGTLYCRIDRKRKFPVTCLLRVLGADTNEKISSLFESDADARKAVLSTLAKDHAKTVEEAYIELHKRLRDGDLATPDNARNFIQTLLSPERYDISRVGRFRFNKRFGGAMDEKALDRRTLSLADVVTTITHIVTLSINPDMQADDIDHLGSRRVRYVGELLEQRIRLGLTQMKRNIQDKMSTVEPDVTMPISFIYPRPLQARIKEFFTANQLSQFMEQVNVLGEIENLRTLTALGPGGLSRERAGFEVRDVHPSHYGRLCPIHTPEGPNIGLVLRLTTYARINDFGMIETPYVRVKNGVVTKEIVYLNALEEENYRIAHAATAYDDDGDIVEDDIEVRINGKPIMAKKHDVDFIDVASNQAFSIATSLIPFLNHDDANRALMGSNMQRQATPCLVPEAPFVATGIERKAVIDTGRVVVVPEDGTITHVDAKRIVFESAKVPASGKGKKHEYRLVLFSRTNGFTAFHQRPIVSVGDKVKKGDIIADTSTSDHGEIPLGHNALVAFMSWSGSNYEDAIILSERVVKNSKWSSVHIEEFVVNVRDTKLGPEVTTCDIPNVGEAKLKNLTEEGIVRIGAEVRPGDILVGKICPKGETQLTPEERLLRSIFGEKARDVKDTSKRMENGKRGRIISVKVFSREKGDKLESGIIKKIYIEVAQVRNVSVGDKMAGRHGNKGVISRILPEEDMPYMEDGTPIDVILTPLGVPSRMNLGQILELHLGLAANTLGYQAIVPPFAGATDAEIKEELRKAGHDTSGKMELRDGRTGEHFDKPIAVGYMYIMKLHHMVEDKIHMRSIGPYSLITQQPLGGKAQGGGQRFGEMEVWALLGHGAAHTLREILTVKSDDIVGRSQTFDAIVKGEKMRPPNLPASFNVLLKTLRGLALNVELVKKKPPADEE
ncbi:MAG: DNA-directed RNA polymerase subunit beta [Candidatus Taylorbacteria bacterium RIFCSPHIGHO2_02_FULL_44_12]|uniref:DNA-directed RNA polymerase subunit beta n=1 Tax=Candidatus Taylorbacteria bacterium RIFCSPHIGHO2_02_FULL_44_12 TaxID=1802308 RepID=A0A1G2MM85_9BACT|nr:MAG: DNA-directed RNA polymerase subunit beta [Candidatus Taylorbacteria bacterium RIFCSPHIGHO2_02_FULL_44_12]